MTKWPHQCPLYRTVVETYRLGKYDNLYVNWQPYYCRRVVEAYRLGNIPNKNYKRISFTKKYEDGEFFVYRWKQLYELNSYCIESLSCGLFEEYFDDIFFIIISHQMDFHILWHSHRHISEPSAGSRLTLWTDTLWSAKHPNTSSITRPT